MASQAANTQSASLSCPSLVTAVLPFLTPPLPLPPACSGEGYDGFVKYQLQPFAGKIWDWGTITFGGDRCIYKENEFACPGFLYIVCGAKGQPLDCAGEL